ncbi:MAG: hypothetical protein JJE25_02165 [Bacteroidia bacterium]|nr:hypothetical protein [Bacteroidia bacterium]
MQSIIFQYTFEHVYKGAKMIMQSKGYNVVKSDHVNGNISFVKKKFLVLPDVKATLNLEKVGSENIRVVIIAKAKGLFFKNQKKSASIEHRIAEVMASII